MVVANFPINEYVKNNDVRMSIKTPLKNKQRFHMPIYSRNDIYTYA